MGEKIEFTNEEREALIGALPFDNSAIYNYTPDKFSELPERIRPIFKLTPLSKQESDLLIKEMSKDDAGNDEFYYNVAAKHVKGWDNYIDIGTMEKIPYVASDSGGCSMDLINKMPKYLVIDITHCLMRISCLMPVDKISLKS